MTGYTSYRIYFYNYTGNQATVGEKTEYYDILFRENGTTDTWEPYSGGYVSPSPNWEQPINNVTGENEIYVDRRNLFNIKGDVNTRYDGTTVTDNTVSENDLITTTNAGNVYPYGQKIYVGAGNTITFSATLKSITPSGISSGTVAYMTIFNDNTTTGANTISFSANQIGTKKEVSITPSTDYIYACFGRASTPTSATFTNIQVERGETSTEYIDYATPQTVLFPLSSGQYMAERDYLADDGTHHVRGKLVLDGTENWQYDSGLGCVVLPGGTYNHKRRRKWIVFSLYL